MKFLIDNALSPLVAQGLIEQGYDAIHVRNIGMAASSDSEIFEVALKEDRIIISADTDFGALLAFRETSKPSFILLKLSDNHPNSQLNFLIKNLKFLEMNLLSGCIVVFEDKRIRVKDLPIEKK